MGSGVPQDPAKPGDKQEVIARVYARGFWDGVEAARNETSNATMPEEWKETAIAAAYPWRASR